MMTAGIVTVYANVIAIMIALGVLALLLRLEFKDKQEKNILIALLTDLVIMAVFYILSALREDRIAPCDLRSAMLIETVLEISINIMAFLWLIYVLYRMFHSVDHIKRNLKVLVVPLTIAVGLDIINLFTGFMFTFDENMQIIELPVYVVTDIIRMCYFVGSLIWLEYYKRSDAGMKFFSVRPFFVPMVFYGLLYYFTPFATATLGLAIGFALIYVEMINEKCYQDGESGFYNRLYLEHLKKEISDGEYELNSAMIFKVTGDDMKKPAGLISKQLPQDCYPIRYGDDTVLTLAGVTQKGPLFMLSEDVEMALEEAGIPVKVKIDLRKKDESGLEFLERFLKKA